MNGSEAELPLRTMRIASLLEAATSAGSCYVELHPGGRAVAMQPPRIIGPGMCDVVRGVTRVVFLAAFDDVVVRSKSSLLEHDGRLLLDYQGAELAAIDLEFELDPSIVGRQNDALTVSDERQRGGVVEIDEALNLVGFTSDSFGHWIIEYLLQWASVRDRSEVRALPILIDADMPPSHREAIDFFSDGGAAFLAVPPGGSVRVRRLWKVSNWLYVPFRPSSEAALDVRFLVPPVERVAQQFRGLAADIDAKSAPGGPTHVYLARRPHLHRRLLNHAAVEAIAEEFGFEVVYPEDLPFEKQLRLVRNATHIVGPEGSALFLAFFARAGTKLCCFDHPFIDKVGPVTTIFAALGIDVTFVTGPCARKDERYARFSDYVVREDQVRSVLSEWRET